MLELKEIIKVYQIVNLVQAALNKVSVALRDNEFVAVLGQSGSGKTTMLSIIGGFDRFQSGDLVIDGIPAEGYKARNWDAYRNDHIGFALQAYGLTPHQTVLASVELALTLSSVSRPEHRKHTPDALKRVGLKEYTREKPSQMSGGQIQRVAIAHALINDSGILLADEPIDALDSKTSVQVMDLLRDMARDRFVIMVTHNPDLAHQYTIRIVELVGGCIVADSDPLVPTTEDRCETKPAHRISMDFLTALFLSANNLMTKGGRTPMTPFTRSIGIISIAAILALANGTNAYIAEMEEETLDACPLTIQRSGIDMTAAPSMSVSDPRNSQPAPDGKVGVSKPRILADMIRDVKANDPASLKIYLDNNGGGIDAVANTIEYDYDIVPQTYQADTPKEIAQANPDQSMKQMEAGFGTGAFGSMMQTNILYQMPATTSLCASAYDVIAGSWPSGTNQVVLVLGEDDNIPNLFEYTLGLENHKEFDGLMRGYYQGALGGRSWSGAQSGASTAACDYSTVLGTTFRRVNAFDKYALDDTYKVWIDRSSGTDYTKRLVDGDQQLTIFGIVKPNSDRGGILCQGIAYTPALTYRIVEEAAASPVVKTQHTKSDVDVLAGKTFRELADNQKDRSGDFDMSSLFTVDESKLSTIFQIDPDKMQMDLSGLNFSGLDLSGLDSPNFDMLGLDLSAIDLSALSVQSGARSGMAFDLSGPDFGELSKSLPQLVNVGFQTIIRSALADSAIRDGAADYLDVQVSQVAQGFQDYTREQIEAGGTIDFATLVSAYFSQPEALEQPRATVSSDRVVDSDKLATNLTKALDEDLALAQIGTDTSTQVMSAISTQTAARLGTTLTQGVSAVIDQVMQEAMTNTMTSMMTQLSAAVGNQIGSTMERFATNMPSAFLMDPQTFAETFQSNVDEKSLTTLVTTTFSMSVSAFEINLRNLGWADITSPSNVSIYPKSFTDKGKVKTALDAYDADNKATDAIDKIVTYSDVMSAFIGSVAKIVDIASWLSIASVSISLVVSPITISVVTYISVLGRRKEISILRSIGASKDDVSHVFNTETVIEDLLAGLIDAGVTYGLRTVASAIAYPSFSMENTTQSSPLTALTLIATPVGLTVVAGVIPTLRTLRRDPAEALRSE